MPRLVVNVEGLPANTGFEAIPAGWYDATIDEVEIGVSNSNNKMVTVTYEIEETGSKVWDYYVVDEEAESDIGRKRFKGLLKTLEFPNIDDTIDIDTDDMHGKRLQVKLKVDKGRKNEETGEVYDDKNKVTSVKAIGAGGSTDNVITQPFSKEDF